MSDYATDFRVKATPANVYAAVNDVRAWWKGDIEGVTDRAGGEFTYRNKEWHRSRQRIAEMTPDRRVVWEVVDSHLTFVAAAQEWTGTRIVFEIVSHDDETELRFTHHGLTPSCQCYNGCSGGWAYFIDGSLKALIETGKGLGPLG